MKKASAFLKQVFSTIVEAVKAKTMAVRTKTSAMKTRLLIFGILRNKKLLMSTINHKIHAIMGQKDKKEGDGSHGNGHDEHDAKKAIVLYNAPSYKEQEEEGEYPDLTHSLFNMEGEEEEEDDEDDKLVNASGSVIELVRNAKEDEGAEFSLEDEIDHAADVFIRRFHKQMKLQKLESFKRYCEMLERSV